MDRPVVATVLFGFGAGVVIEAAARKHVSGPTVVFAIVGMGTFLAAAGVFAADFIHWQLPYQITVAMLLSAIAFIYWIVWISSPYMVTAEQNVAPVTAADEAMIRQAAVGLLIINGLLLAWVYRRGQIFNDNHAG